MRSTGKFDRNGKEIFEGDKVIHGWGWFRNPITQKVIHYKQIHTITVNPAHLMNNGQMHDDGGGIVFCLGKAYNYWAGKTVTKITDQEAKAIGISEDTNYFLDENGKAIEFTDQHFMGLTDEEWQLEKEGRRKLEYEWLFGKQSTPPSSHP